MPRGRTKKRADETPSPPPQRHFSTKPKTFGDLPDPVPLRSRSSSTVKRPVSTDHLRKKEHPRNRAVRLSRSNTSLKKVNENVPISRTPHREAASTQRGTSVGGRLPTKGAESSRSIIPKPRSKSLEPDYVLRFVKERIYQHTIVQKVSDVTFYSNLYTVTARSLTKHILRIKEEDLTEHKDEETLCDDMIVAIYDSVICPYFVSVELFEKQLKKENYLDLYYKVSFDPNE